MTRSLEKADGDLVRALEANRASDEVLTVLLTLRAGYESLPSRAEHATKRAWQRAVSEAQGQAAAVAYEPFVRALRGQGLEIERGGSGRVMIVRGRSSQIVDALEADVVERASLDAPLERGA